MRKKLIVTLLVCALGLPVAWSQVADQENDADIPCVDLVLVDMRADAEHLAVSVQTSPRPYPSEYVFEGLDDPNSVRLCPNGLYTVTLDANLDGEPDVTLQTHLDSDGEPTTSGAPSVDAAVDVTAGTITWSLALEDLHLGQLPSNILAQTHAAIVPPNPVQPLEPWDVEDSAPESPVEMTVGAAASALIGPAGGVISVDDQESDLLGTILTIPEDALAEPTPVAISIPESTASIGVGDSQGPRRMRILPAEAKLSGMAELLIPYGDLQSAAENPHSFTIILYDTENEAWISPVRSSNDHASLTVSTASLDVFGDWAVFQDAVFAPVSSTAKRPDGWDGPCQPSDGKPLTILVHGHQPFSGIVSDRDVLCTAGFGDEQGTFESLGFYLREEDPDGSVCTFSYATGKDIRSSANALRGLLSSVDMAHPVSEIRLLGHSQGGLVIRTMMEDAYASGKQPAPASLLGKVTSIVTAGTPHLGLTSARMRHCTSLRQMVPCSDFLECPNGGGCDTESDFPYGLNWRVREHHEQFGDLFDKYHLFAAWDDRVVEQNSATGRSCFAQQAAQPADYPLDPWSYDRTAASADWTCDNACKRCYLQSDPTFALECWKGCKLICAGEIQLATGFPGWTAHSDGIGQCVIPVQSPYDGDPQCEQIIRGEDNGILFPEAEMKTLPERPNRVLSLVHSNSQSKVRSPLEEYPTFPDHEPTTLGVVHVRHLDHPAYQAICSAIMQKACRPSANLFTENWDYLDGEDFTNWWPGGDTDSMEIERSGGPWGPNYLHMDGGETFSMSKGTGIAREDVENRVVILRAAMRRYAFSERYYVSWGGLRVGFDDDGYVVGPNATISGQKRLSTGLSTLWYDLLVVAQYEEGGATARVFLDDQPVPDLQNVLFYPNLNSIDTVYVHHAGEWWDGGCDLDDIRITVMGEEPGGTPAEGRVAHWEFEGNLLDSGPGAHHGDFVGSPLSYGDGMIGQALSFPESEIGYVRVTDESAFDIRDEVSVEAWVYSVGAESRYQGIVNKGKAWEGPYELRMTRTWPYGDGLAEDLGCGEHEHALFFHVSTEENGWSGDGPNDYGTCLTKKEWHHVAGTYDGSAVRVYVDGYLMSERAHSGRLMENDLPIVIGSNGATWNEVWSGLIDEVMIYDRALTPSEIAAHAGVGGPVLREDWESAENGGLPEGWRIWKGGGAYTGVVDTEAHRGDKSVKLVGRAYGGADIVHDISTDADQLRLEFYLKVLPGEWTGATDGEAKVCLDWNGRMACAGILKRGPSFYYFDSATRHSTTALASVDRWVKMVLEIDYDTNESRAFFDGESEPTFSSALPPSSGHDWVLINSGNGSTGRISAVYDDLVLEEVD